jgi:gluconolactonase
LHKFLQFNNLVKIYILLLPQNSLILVPQNPLAMRKFAFAGYLLLCAACHSTTNSKVANQPVNKEPIKRKVEIFDTSALAVIDSNARIEVLDSGHKWTEGPLYIKDGNYVLFSDIPNNSIYKWKEGDGAALYLKPSGKTGNGIAKREPGSNALLLNARGQLVLCQHGDRRMALMDAPLDNPLPNFITLADKYQGKRLNSPNDAVFVKNGDMYFTDPPYGLDKRLDDTARQLPFQGVYRLTPGGKLDVIIKDVKFPNGLAFSPDGKTFYLSNSDSTNMQWLKYDVDDKGFVKNGTVMYEPKQYNNTNAGNPDGMKVNRQGYIFAAGPKGIWIFNPFGKPIARIYTGQKTSNCAFTPDEKDLFITGSAELLHIKLK